jgi:ATP-binding cassette, subfamily B, bacterial PglK
MNLRKYWRSTTIGRSARVLSRRDQQKIGFVVLLQIFLGLLDLVGVAVVGILGALAVTGVQSRQPGNRVDAALKILHLHNSEFQVQVAVLACLATFFLVCRTIFSALFMRRILFFLSRRGAHLSASLVSRLLSRSLIDLQKMTNQETLFSVTTGVTTVTNGVLGVAVALVSDGSLLLVMSVGLFIVDPLMALSTFLVFLCIGFLMYRLLHQRANTLGRKSADLSVKSNEKVFEVLNSYRESVVRNRRNFYAREIGKLRLEMANTDAELSFMPNISKYVIETTVVLGALIISGVQFGLRDAAHAVATLAVFLAAGSRIAPAVLRLQQGALAIRSNLGSARLTLELIDSLGESKPSEEVSDNLELVHSGFVGSIEISNVSFKYPLATETALNGIDLIINEGSTVALVGPSGAGKTSIVDVLLGVLSPDSGKVLISGLEPSATVSRWPGAISYVPQDVIVTNGSIRENVSLGFPVSVATDELVMDALKLAQADDFVSELPMGMDTSVGDRGTKLSGGQRQRIGIARALFTRPKLLVLDEATSSLDGQTESDISQAIQGLKGSVTVVMIAHRLATVLNADQVIYMDKGRIIAQGTFEEVRRAVPDFDAQAKLMGL